MTKQYKTVNQPLNAEGLLKLDLQTFSEPPAPEETAPVAEPPAPPIPPVETPPTAEPIKTFSQEDVNGIVKKESSKQTEKLLKDLGIEDFGNAKEGLTKFREWQESQKTEQQKKDEKLQELETNYSSTSDENTVLKAQISAMKVGVKADSVSDVVTLAKTMLSDEVDMDAAIAAIVGKYPHFAEAAPEESSEAKPKFSNGQHQTQPQSEMDKWAAAFKS